MKCRVAPLAPPWDAPAWWQPLFEASGCASVFLSVAWLQIWLDVYANDFEGEWLSWEVDGHVVGGCLVLERVIRVKGVPLHSVFLNLTGIASTASPLAEFNDVLHLQGYENAIATDLARWLQRRPWSRCFLSGYEEGSVCAKLATLIDSAHVERETRAAPYVDLGPLGDRKFCATLTGRNGTRVRRNRSLYENQLGAITVRPAATLDEAMEFFDDMRRLHLARWDEQGETTSLSSPEVIDFHQRLIRRLWGEAGVEIVRVGAVDEAVGYLYNFVLQRKVCIFQTGFNYKGESSLSPGILTHTLAIEHYRERAMLEYDFLAGDAAYKRLLANRHRDLYWTVMYRDHLWVRAYLLGRSVWSRLASKQPAGKPN